MKTYLEIKEGDEVEKFVYWIWQLSPHNLWKAVEEMRKKISR